VARVNFQVTVLKILVSYPDGFAVMVDLKRDMAIGLPSDTQRPSTCIVQRGIGLCAGQS